MKSLTARDRRALRLGALVLGPALFVTLGATPYVRALARLDEAVVRERDLLAREQALLMVLRQYPRRFDRSRDALLREAPRLFSGPDLGATSAALANYVGASAIGHRVFVQHSETKSPESADQGVARLQVDLRAVGDLEGILGFLQTLETGSKLVTVEQITIAPAARLNAGASSDEEVLALAATVAGYVLEEPR